MIRTGLVFVLLAALVGACGGREPLGGSDAGTNNNNSQTNNSNNNGNNNSGTPDSGVPWNGMPSRNILVRFALDGDTLIVSANATVRTPDGRPMDGEKIRLIGVDAPEIAHGNSGADCFGDEAHEFTRSAVEGRIVTLDYDTTKCLPPNEVVGCRDDFDRLLAYVVLGDEVHNQNLLSTGHARVFRGARFEHRDTDLYRQLESQARNRDLGLWSCP